MARTNDYPDLDPTFEGQLSLGTFEVFDLVSLPMLV